MTVHHGASQWEAEILEVYNVSTKRNPFHNQMTIEGKAKVTPDEEEPMIFDFTYTGTPKEDKKRILNYVKGIALDMWLESRKKKEDTLQDYIGRLVQK